MRVEAPLDAIEDGGGGIVKEEDLDRVEDCSVLKEVDLEKADVVEGPALETAVKG